MAKDDLFTETIYYQRKTPAPASIYVFETTTTEERTTVYEQAPSGGRAASSAKPSRRRASVLPRLVKRSETVRRTVSAIAAPAGFRPTLPPRIPSERWSGELSKVVLVSGLAAALIMSVSTFKADYFDFAQYKNVPEQTAAVSRSAADALVSGAFSSAYSYISNAAREAARAIGLSSFQR